MRLLAFGDSLTAGYHSQGLAFAPWAPLLEQLLGDSVKVDHLGLSGFTSQQMLDSAEQQAVTDVVPRTWPGYSHKLRLHQYDVVIILCGTNDLADQEPTQHLVRNIAQLHSVAHAAGARSVAMTIPDSKAAQHIDWLRRARHDANEAIRAWAATQPGVHFVDAAVLVPYSDTSGLWEPDGLHMSQSGYEAFGRGLGPLISDFVKAVAPRCQLDGDSAAGTDAAARPRGWWRGTTVRIVGLTKATHHNGKTGKLSGTTGRDGRVGVELDDHITLAVRSVNLEIVAPACASSCE